MEDVSVVHAEGPLGTTQVQAARGELGQHFPEGIEFFERDPDTGLSWGEFLQHTETPTPVTVRVLVIRLFKNKYEVLLVRTQKSGLYAFPSGGIDGADVWPRESDKSNREYIQEVNYPYYRSMRRAFKEDVGSPFPTNEVYATRRFVFKEEIPKTDEKEATIIYAVKVYGTYDPIHMKTATSRGSYWIKVEEIQDISRKERLDYEENTVLMELLVQHHLIAEPTQKSACPLM